MHGCLPTSRLLVRPTLCTTWCKSRSVHACMDRVACVTDVVDVAQDLLDAERLPPLMAQDVYPLCMNQYKRCFASTRIPGLEEGWSLLPSHHCSTNNGFFCCNKISSATWRILATLLCSVVATCMLLTSLTPPDTALPPSNLSGNDAHILCGFDVFLTFIDARQPVCGHPQGQLIYSPCWNCW